MSANFRAYTVGDAVITAISVGDMHLDFAKCLVAPAADQSPVRALFPQPSIICLQAFHIAMPGGSYLVDTPLFEEIPGTVEAIAGYTPPPGLRPALEQAGLQPDSLGHVVFTHAHTDHINGAVQERDGSLAPCFPNASHYLHRAEWDRLSAELADPASLASCTLGVLDRWGLLEVVEADLDLGEVSLIHAPGETPGHLIVRVHSNGATAYCVGDLFHHPVEIERDWIVNWADAEAKRRSRASLAANALRESALILPAHVAGGRLVQGSAGLVWDPV